jgi:SGNH domain (fused to AT3 domains)
MMSTDRFGAEFVGFGIRKHQACYATGKAIVVVLLAFVTTVTVCIESTAMASGASASKSTIGVLPGVLAAQLSIVNAGKPQALNQNLVSQLGSEANSRFVDTCASQPAGGNPSPAAVACSYGDTSAQQTLVLYGDSYVEQWLPAFAALGKQDHFKVLAYVRYGCPFAAVPERDYLDSVDTGCAQFRHNVVAAINAMTPPPSLTILAELQLKVEAAPNGSVLPFGAFASGIRTTLKQLNVKPVGVLLGTPIAASNPVTCLSAHVTHVQVCATPTAAAFSTTRDKDDAAAVTQSHDVVVNLSSLFCGTQCPDVIGNSLVFADQWHLDASYAQQVTTAVGSLVGCMGTEVPATELQPGGILQSLLADATQPSIVAACKAAGSTPYNL